MRNKPPYALRSVDNALQLIQLLRDQGSLRVSEAAAELGIARSTTHRLLAMLVYRGFAEQDSARSYLPGPALTAATPLGGDLQRLRAAAAPVMERLCEQTEETVNLTVRVGTHTRFLASLESTQVLHVGDRRGAILPAARTSGGKALLAELPPAELAELYGIGTPAQALTGAEWDQLVAQLRLVRRRGYAVNVEETEAGICALGIAVHDPGGAAGGAVAALSVALPSVRYDRQRVGALAGALRTAVDVLEQRLDGTR